MNYFLKLIVQTTSFIIIMSGQGQEAPSSEQMWEIILQQRKELADFRSYVTDHLKDQQEVFHLVFTIWFLQLGLRPEILIVYEQFWG